MKVNGIDFNENYVKSLSFKGFLACPLVKVHNLSTEQATSIYELITGNKVSKAKPVTTVEEKQEEKADDNI